MNSCDAGANAGSIGVEVDGDDAADWALGADPDAFVAIFDLHCDRVYRYALPVTANVYDAEDVTNRSRHFPASRGLYKISDFEATSINRRPLCLV
jgi:hypothetical protein